jgi:ferritin-like metal-binding protein YciE
METSRFLTIARAKESGGTTASHMMLCESGGGIRKLVKRAITEISCYNILIAAAAAVGERETRAARGDILCQEEAMLSWLKNYLASATVEYLSPEEAPEGAASTLSKP